MTDYNHSTLSLIISCCYLPYIDACAITVAKRIRTWGGIIDVISQDEENSKTKDNSLFAITEGFVNKHVAIKDSKINLANGTDMEGFAKKVLAQAISWHSLNNKKYDKLYSRALKAASHAAAIVYKTNFPEVKWLADFSDPVLYNMDNSKRVSSLSVDWYNKYIKGNLVLKGLDSNLIDNNNNAYLWMELMPFILAEEVMFTNPNQMEFMLNKILGNMPFKQDTNNELMQQIRKKCIIGAHPTLPKEFYSLGLSSSPSSLSSSPSVVSSSPSVLSSSPSVLSSSPSPSLGKDLVSLGKCVNSELELRKTKEPSKETSNEKPSQDQKKKIAYFGLFYNQRNFNDIVNLVVRNKGNLEAYIFSNNIPKHFKQSSKKIGNIVLSDFINYFDFLASIDSYDAVIVIDSVVNHVLGTNPYLPSKFSDYMGAETPIWLMTEKDSYLDKLELIDNKFRGRSVYRSRIGDVNNHMKIWQIILKHSIS